MQRVAFYAVIGAGYARIGVVSRANPDLIPTRKAQTKTQAVLKLESRSQPVAFDFSVREQRNPDPGLDLGVNPFTGDFVHKYGRERQAVTRG